MKISEVIKELECLKDSTGDMEVYLKVHEYSKDGGSGCIRFCGLCTDVSTTVGMV